VLAFTDQGLAHLVIAAGRVRRERRAAWLLDLAHRVETERKRAAAVRRTRAHRQRQRDGQRYYRLLIDDAAMEPLLDGLVRAGRLSEADTMRQEAIEGALAEALADPGRRWRSSCRS